MDIINSTKDIELKLLRLEDSLKVIKYFKAFVGVFFITTLLLSLVKVNMLILLIPLMICLLLIYLKEMDTKQNMQYWALKYLITKDKK
jgi:hypothetical protein